MKLVETTHEVIMGDWVYRIHGDLVNQKYIIKCVPTANVLWSHCGYMRIWDGKKFTQAIAAEICRVSTLEECTDIICNIGA